MKGAAQLLDDPAVIADPQAKPRWPHPEGLDLKPLSLRFTKAGYESFPRTGVIDIAKALPYAPQEIATPLTAVMGVTVALTDKAVAAHDDTATISADRSLSTEGKNVAVIRRIDQLRATLPTYEKRIADGHEELVALLRPLPPRSGDAVSMARHHMILEALLALNDRQRAQLVRQTVQRLEQPNPHPRDRETLLALYGYPHIVQVRLFGEQLAEYEAMLGRALFPERAASADWMQWALSSAQFTVDQVRNWSGVVRAAHGQPVDAAYQR